MAPTAVRQDHQPLSLPSKHLPSAGQALEAISDAIDAVNALQSQPPSAYAAPIPPSSAPAAARTDRDRTSFRQYETACARVRDFYRDQHTRQTLAYNVAVRARFDDPARPRPEMTVWDALHRLDDLVDESDPDTDLSQTQHLVQTAEALRRDGQPRWMQLVGLIHDLGKLMLVLFNEDDGDGDGDGTRARQQRQWDVVGDTFPVGCAFDRRIVLASDTFGRNPDARHPVYGTRHGIYEPGCGLDRVLLSWGHDEYLYRVVRDQSRLPADALAVIRYHSFYPWHRDGAYRHLMAPSDHARLRAVQAFNPYDLYSKADDPPPPLDQLKPYYADLIDEFFPQRVIKW